MTLPLHVLETEAPPWFAPGLTFTCSQCGNCCTGAPGYVWISEDEIDRLAKHLKMRRSDVIENHCRKIGQRYSLKENRTPQGLYDCVFLKSIKVRGANGVMHVKRICGIYEARPLQCRTWPFWDGVLASKENWESAGQRCHGINAGNRRFAREQIESLRDATDWPENPPTSE